MKVQTTGVNADITLEECEKLMLDWCRLIQSKSFEPKDYSTIYDFMEAMRGMYLSLQVSKNKIEITL